MMRLKDAYCVLFVVMGRDPVEHAKRVTSMLRRRGNALCLHKMEENRWKNV